MSQSFHFKPSLPPRLSEALQKNCADCPPDEIESLRAEVQAHLSQLKHELHHNEFLDIGTTGKIAAVLDRLLSHLDKFPPDHRPLIVGAARYFIQDLDLEPDSRSILGMDDDVKVLNYVLEQVGLSNLRVEL